MGFYEASRDILRFGFRTAGLGFEIYSFGLGARGFTAKASGLKAGMLKVPRQLCIKNQKFNYSPRSGRHGFQLFHLIRNPPNPILNLNAVRPAPSTDPGPETQNPPPPAPPGSCLHWPHSFPAMIRLASGLGKLLLAYPLSVPINLPTIWGTSVS